MVKFILFILLVLGKGQQEKDFIYVSKEINVFSDIKDMEVFKEIKEEPVKVLATYKGNITAYGPDCKGCSGITSSGYKVSSKNIYYKDKEYGKVRIVAADKSLPFGSIIRIKDLSVFKDDIIAIVLDRGSAIGFKKKVYFDLLYESEKKTSSFGKHQATFELLRRGY